MNEPLLHPKLPRWATATSFALALAAAAFGAAALPAGAFVCACLMLVGVPIVVGFQQLIDEQREIDATLADLRAAFPSVDFRGKKKSGGITQIIASFDRASEAEIGHLQTAIVTKLKESL